MSIIIDSEIWRLYHSVDGVSSAKHQKNKLPDLISQSPDLKKLIMAQNNAPTPTIADKVIEVLERSDVEMRTRDLTAAVAKEMQSTTDAVAQELTALVRDGKIRRPRQGYYELPEMPKKDESSELVISQDELARAAIIFYNGETKEIWATAELRLDVTIRKPMKIIGGKPDKDVDWNIGGQ